MVELTPQTWPFLDWHGIWAGYVSYDEEGRYFPQDLPRGVKLSMQQAELSEPVMRRERRWEAGNLHHPALIQEGGRIRMWYMAFASRDDPWVKAGNIPGKAPTLWCYAESTDGYHWERPNLGLFEFDGSRENNILFVASEAGTYGYTHLIHDPVGPDAERYKAIALDSDWSVDGRPATRDEAMEFRGQLQAAGDGRDQIAERVKHQLLMRGGVSPDGLRWTHLPEPIMRPPYLLDTQNILTYDPDIQKYVIYLRGHRDRRRAVVRYESDQFHRGWERPHMALCVDPQDPPDTDIYGPCYCRYPGGRAHLMFFNPYHRASDVIDIHLAISHDGMNWCRPERKPIIPLTRDYGTMYGAPNLVTLADDRRGLLVLAYPHAHNEADRGEASEYFWATWKRDRLVALEAESYGEVTLVERPCAGEPIRLNLQTQHGGWVKAELVAGVPNRTSATLPPAIPGYSFDDCQPLSGDALEAPVCWGSSSDLTRLRGRKLHLRLKMAQAKLFAVTM
jgi:hypothetical protein